MHFLEIQEGKGRMANRKNNKETKSKIAATGLHMAFGFPCV